MSHKDTTRMRPGRNPGTKTRVCQPARLREPSTLVTSDESRLIMPCDIFDEILCKARLLDIEISGLGLVEITQSNDLLVTRLLRVKQTCGGGHTKLDDGDLHRVMAEIAGGNSVIRFWWHSHHAMSAFWSGTDRATNKLLFGNGWGVSLVVAHDGSYKAILTCGVPVQHTIDLTIAVTRPEVPLDVERCAREIQEDIQEEWATLLCANKGSDPLAPGLDKWGGISPGDWDPEDFYSGHL